jgi:hypothetical protein
MYTMYMREEMPYLLGNYAHATIHTLLNQAAAEAAATLHLHFCRCFMLLQLFSTDQVHTELTQHH